jgi:hypothetical protein
MINETETSWNDLVEKLNKRFEGDLDMQAILFLIGLQELGQGYKKYAKDEKVNIMHVAICTLLEPYGYYEFIGKDEDGWPHWKANEKLPPLKPGQQLQLMKQAVLEYFNEEGGTDK